MDSFLFFILKFYFLIDFDVAKVSGGMQSVNRQITALQTIITVSEYRMKR